MVEGVKKAEPRSPTNKFRVCKEANGSYARKDILSQYFELLEQTLTKNDLRFKLYLIFNCDESAIILNKLSKHVLVLRRNKCAHAISKANNAHVSILCASSADPVSVVQAMDTRRLSVEGKSSEFVCDFCQ